MTIPSEKFPIKSLGFGLYIILPSLNLNDAFAKEIFDDI